MAERQGAMGLQLLTARCFPVAGTSVQAREIWGKIALLAVLDEMVVDW